MNEPKFPPVRKQIQVQATPERAFLAFTQRIDAWWPRSHQIGKTSMKRSVLEPNAGGRWYEIGEDGAECDWGKVLIWDPPHRLLLAWQINGHWKFDPTLITEVEVRFREQSAGSTLVELEHRNIERFGESAQPVRAAFDSPEGWGGILLQFAKIAHQEKKDEENE